MGRSHKEWHLSSKMEESRRDKPCTIDHYAVDTGVDVAKETADIVLQRKDLGVLISAIRHGRRTFVNTLKYVFMATSANFGNMFSMAGASLFLPFLPLLPKQILDVKGDS